MNMQTMMKQAQQLQKEVLKEQDAINKMTFEGKVDKVKIEINGQKEVLKIEIAKDENINKDDIEMFEDMLMVAFNEAIKKVDKITKERLGKYGAGLDGLF